MTVVFTGGCLCGGVRYASSSAPLAMLYCHCKDCQRCTGGPFAAVVVVPKSAVSITQGEPKSYSVTGEAGGVVYRRFCPDCGSPLFSGLEGDENLFALKAGSMDDSSGLEPMMHIWTKLGLVARLLWQQVRLSSLTVIMMELRCRFSM